MVTSPKFSPETKPHLDGSTCPGCPHLGHYPCDVCSKENLRDADSGLCRDCYRAWWFSGITLRVLKQRLANAPAPETRRYHRRDDGDPSHDTDLPLTVCDRRVNYQHTLGSWDDVDCEECLERKPAP